MKRSGWRPKSTEANYRQAPFCAFCKECLRMKCVEDMPILAKGTAFPQMAIRLFVKRWVEKAKSAEASNLRFNNFQPEILHTRKKTDPCRRKSAGIFAEWEVARRCARIPKARACVWGSDRIRRGRDSAYPKARAPAISRRNSAGSMAGTGLSGKSLTFLVTMKSAPSLLAVAACTASS